MTTYSLNVAIYFLDGGPREVMTIQRGTLSECEMAQELLPAVSYSGTRPVERAETFLREEEE